MQNPATVQPAGDVRITTVMRYTTPAAGRWYQIDTLRAPSDFQATVGTIDGAKISVDGPTTNTAMTFAEMQTYYFRFTTKHAVPRGGFVKVVIPRAFTVVYPSTTTAQLQCMGANDKVNYCSVFATSAGVLNLADPSQDERPFVIGMAKVDLPMNTEFTLRVAGLQNPRYVISWAALTKAGDTAQLEKMQWEVQTFGPAAWVQTGSTGKLSADEQVDVGKGGHVDVDKPTPISAFSAEAVNATNGVEATYYLTWSTVLRTLQHDRFYVEFPPETELIPTKGDALACTGLNGFAQHTGAVTCERAYAPYAPPATKPKTKQLLIMTFADVPT